MVNLNSVARICMQEVENAGIVYGNILSFKVNSRAKSRWGQCKKTMFGYEIEISSRLLESENSMNGLKETIIHEILHTCYGCMNHGDLWTSYANRMNSLYGYNIKRTSSSADKGVKPIERKVNYKYKLYCTGCGACQYYERKSKVINHPENYTCGKCGGSFKVVCL